jgi:C-methyltransferase
VDSRGLWAYLNEHPDEAEMFDHAMTGKAIAGVAGVLATYDFGRFTTIVDVGGGRGHLLRAVLDAAPSATGVLFDLPEVIQRLQVGHQRMITTAGSFFADPLPQAAGGFSPTGSWLSRVRFRRMSSTPAAPVVAEATRASR